MNPSKLSVENPVPVNIIMFLIIFGGIYYAFTLIRELFPETAPQRITIATIYKGSSPLEIEKGVTVKIEDKVKSLDGVDTIFSSSSEIGSVVTLQLEEGFKGSGRLLNEVKSEVDKITDLPKEAEKPTIKLVKPLLPVIAFSFYGEVPRERLRKLGIKAREEILAIPGITEVEVTGIQNPEIAVEIKPDDLIRYHLTFQELYQTISRSNLDLPGGKLKSSQREILLRTIGEVYTGRELQNLILRRTENGSTILLRDVANVKDTFEEDAQYRRFNGKTSVEVVIFKTSEQDALELARKIKDYVAKIKQNLPQGVYVEVHSELSKYIYQRLDLLERNGVFGLILVFLSLLLFLSVVLALWSALGLIIAFLGTFILMYLLGVTINLMSMFALIVVLGMLVDDAIIVGENIYRHVEEGADAYTAAIRGTQEVALPVTAAILTTISAFLPLLLMEGNMGQFMRVMPIVVTAALIVSLFESLFILPSHLAETLNPKAIRKSLYLQTNQSEEQLPLWKKIRLKQLFYLNILGKTSLVWVLRRLLPWRYVVVFAMICITIIVITLGAVLVPFVVIQKMDADTFTVNINMPVGTPLEKTQEYIRKIEPFFVQVPEKKHLSTLIGVQVAFQTHGFEFTGNTGDKAQIFMELVEPEERKRTSFEIIRDLREKIEKIPGPESLKFEGLSGGPQGQDIEIELQGQDFTLLKKAAEDLKNYLRDFDGVHDIGDNFQPGKREIKIELKDTGRAMGLLVDDIATQVRSAVYGLEADKFFRDKEEVKIMIRYPAQYRKGLWNLDTMRISTPGGGMAYLKDVCDLKMGRAYQSIDRTDQKRTITVMADVDYKKNTPTKVLQIVERDYKNLSARFPGVTMRFKGAKLEAQKSITSLVMSFGIAILLIYSILASQFGSYIQPFIVMFAVPFGIVGAISGHILMGYVLTILSLVGIVALSGIVVNDSLVLVDFINNRVRSGKDTLEAVIESCELRMRPILLTSITTILGLAPLMLETSMQAKFLIPMAISITFGLAFATVLTLVVVPCFYLIVEDCKSFFYRIWRGPGEDDN